MLDTAVKTGGKELVQRVFQKGSRYAATTNWDKALKNLNPETIKAIPKEITDEQLGQIKNLADVKPEAATELMGDFQHGVQDKEWGNFGAGLVNLDKASKGDEFRALKESPLPEKEFVQVEQSEFPSRYDVEGREGISEVRGNLSKWLKEQEKIVGGDTKKIKRENFAPEGIFIDGEERGISGITRHLKDGTPVKLDAIGPAQFRAKQSDPSKIPVVVNYLDESHKAWHASGGKEGIHPDLTIDEFKTYINAGARKADDLTSELAEEWGIKLDKEHMMAIGNRATNDARSQMPGSETFNRRMGKIDSFSNEVMLILGLPGTGGKAAKKFKSPKVQAKADQRAQSGWLQAVTDWAATDGASLDDMASWNPGDLLTASDKLKIQQASLTGNQMEVAQTILTERRIAEAYKRAGLGKTADEKAALKRILTTIDTDEKVLKAKRSAAEQDLEYRTSQGKQFPKKETVTKYPRVEPK